MNNKKSNCCYRVYLHVFPNGKKYVGNTKQSLKNRWDGGFGYEHQDRVFDAICKYGWNNIRHYLLFDGLDKETALLIEAALIKKWKTHKKTYGYNAKLPNIDGLDTFIIPKFKRVEVSDACRQSEIERVKSRSEKRISGTNAGSGHPKSKMVYCPEFDEIFCSITEASISTGASLCSINHCLNGRQKTAGTHYITGKRLHWEYADK